MGTPDGRRREDNEGHASLGQEQAAGDRNRERLDADQRLLVAAVDGPLLLVVGERDRLIFEDIII